MAAPHDPLPPIPPLIRVRLLHLRARWRRLTIIRGGSAAAVTFVLAMLAGIGLDRFLFLSPWVRALLLPAGVAATLSIAYVRVLRPLARSVGEARLAAWVESVYPRLEERLLSAVGLPAGADGVSPNLVEALLRETEERAREIRFERAISAAGPVRTLAAAALLFLAVVAGIAVSPDFGLLAKRFLNPGGNYPRVSRVRLDVRPGNLTVPSGDAVTVIATARAGSPSRARLYRDAGNGWVAEPMEPAGARAFRWTAPAVAGPFAYFVRAGDAETPRFRISVVPRPDVAGFSARIRYPGYTGRPEAAVPGGGDDVEAPQGSQVWIEARATQSLAEAALVLKGGGKTPMEVRDRAASSPASAPLEVRGEAEFAIHVKALSGYWNLDPPPHRLRVKADEPPRLSWRDPASDLSLPEAGTVPVSALAEDDYGVAKASLAVAIERGKAALPESRTPLSLEPAGGTRARLGGRIDLKALGARPGDVFSIRVEAEDGRPPALGGPGTGKSEERKIRIVAGAPTIAAARSMAVFAAARGQVLRAIDQLPGAGGDPAAAKARLEAALAAEGGAVQVLRAGAGAARDAGDPEGARDLVLLADALSPLARDGVARALKEMGKPADPKAPGPPVAAVVEASREGLARYAGCLAWLHAFRGASDVAARVASIRDAQATLRKDAAGLAGKEVPALAPVEAALRASFAPAVADEKAVAGLPPAPDPSIAKAAEGWAGPGFAALASASELLKEARRDGLDPALAAAERAVADAAAGAEEVRARLAARAEEARRALEAMRDPAVAAERAAEGKGALTKEDLEALKKAAEEEAARRAEEAKRAAALAAEQEALRDKLQAAGEKLEAIAQKQEGIADSARDLGAQAPGPEASDAAQKAADAAAAAAAAIRSPAPESALPKQGEAAGALDSAAKAPGQPAAQSQAASSLAGQQRALQQELQSALGERAAALAALQKEQQALQHVAESLAADVAKPAPAPASMTGPPGTNAAPAPQNTGVSPTANTQTPTPSSGTPSPAGAPPPAGQPPAATTAAPGAAGAGTPGLPALTPPVSSPPDLSNQGLGAGAPGLTGKSSLAEGGQQALPGAPSLPGSVASAAVGGAVQRMDQAADGIVTIPKSAEDLQADAAMLLKYASQVLGDRAAAAMQVAAAVDPTQPMGGLEGLGTDNVDSPFEGIVAPGGAIDIQGGGFEGAPGVPLPGSAFGTSAAGQTVPTTGVSIGGFTGGGPGGAPAGGVPLAAGGVWNGKVLDVKWAPSDWGKLPGHLQNKLKQARGQAFSPDYESRVREYFKRISEQATEKR